MTLYRLCDKTDKSLILNRYASTLGWQKSLLIELIYPNHSLCQKIESYRQTKLDLINGNDNYGTFSRPWYIEESSSETGNFVDSLSAFAHFVSYLFLLAPIQSTLPIVFLF